MKMLKFALLPFLLVSLHFIITAPTQPIPKQDPIINIGVVTWGGYAGAQYLSHTLFLNYREQSNIKNLNFS